MPEEDSLRIFTGTANPNLASDIAKHLDTTVADCAVGKFSDGEISLNIKESVRGYDIFIVQPTCIPVNDNLMEILIMIDALRRASARRITVVLPYFGYSRQDRKTKPREPITAKLVANLIAHAGATRVLCLDLHSGQIQGFFDLPVDHLYAGPLIAEYLVKQGYANGNTVVVSPDVGGVARARALAIHLNASIAIIVKRRPAPNTVEITEIIGEVQDKVCIMIDDIIDTGNTIVLGAEAMLQRGAKEVHACCTHPILSKNGIQRLQESPLSSVVVTDTIPLPKDQNLAKFKVVSVAGLLAEAIMRIHKDDSVSEMFSHYASH